MQQGIFRHAYCKICGNILPPGKSKYCSHECYKADLIASDRLTALMDVDNVESSPWESTMPGYRRDPEEHKKLWARVRELTA